MAGENEVTVVAVKEAVDELRKQVEQYGTDSSEYKEAVDRTAEILEKDQKAQEQIVSDMTAERKAREELEVRVKEFEAEMAKFSAAPINPKTAYKEAAEYKALEKYFQHGEKGLDAEEIDILEKANKTMRMDDDTQGGYLTTTEFDNIILKNITEISPVRQHARVRTVSKKTLDIPKRTAIPVASYEGEAAAGDDDNSTYGSEQLTTYRLTVTIPFTMDLLMDSAFDLESEINGDVTEAMAYKEGNKFVLGTGAKQPEGFLVNPTVVAAATNTITALTVAGDDLLLLTGQLKKGYNPMFGFNRGTLAFLRTLKASTAGTYIWQASLAPGVPNTIGGDPYAVFPDMPLYSTANALSVVYADFMRGYTITDRTGMVIIRDQYAKKRQAIIEITFHRWNTGQVVLPEAFAALKTKAS